MKIKIYITMLTLSLMPSSLFSQVGLSKLAQSTMNFLIVGTSPRATALGEAYTALGTGSESMFYNPAGLSEMTTNFDVNINYTKWIADINYLSGGIAYNLGNYGVIGINLLTVDYGTLNATSLITSEESLLYPLGYKEDGKMTNVGAYSVGLSYARAISQEFSIGGTIKFAGQNLGVNNFSNGITRNNNATKLAFDGGIRFKTLFRSFTFGMSIRNFASNIRREEIDEQLPMVFSLGASMNIMEVINQDVANDNKINVAVDFLHFNNYSERINLGIEYQYMNMISLRTGYQTNHDISSWSAGIGFNTSISDYKVGVNYSFAKFDIFSNVSRLNLVFSF